MHVQHSFCTSEQVCRATSLFSIQPRLATSGSLRYRYYHMGRTPVIYRPVKIHSHADTETSHFLLFCEACGVVVRINPVAHMKNVSFPSKRQAVEENQCKVLLQRTLCKPAPHCRLSQSGCQEIVCTGCFISCQKEAISQTLAHDHFYFFSSETEPIVLCLCTLLSFILTKEVKCIQLTND